MATNAQGKVSASDFTGRERERLAAEAAVEAKLREDEISTTLNAQKIAETTEVHDVTGKPEVPVVVDETEVVVEDGDDAVVIRVNEDIQQATISGVTYDFKAGQKYKVPRNVAFVLEERGKVWH